MSDKYTDIEYPWLRLCQAVLVQALEDLTEKPVRMSRRRQALNWLRSPDGAVLALSLGYDEQVQTLLLEKRLMLPLIMVSTDNPGETIPLFLCPGSGENNDRPIF